MVGHYKTRTPEKEAEAIKASNELWLKRDYKKIKEKQILDARKKSSWYLNGLCEEPYIPGLKRFKACRG